MIADDIIVINGENRFRSPPMTKAEHQLWEDFHDGYSPSVACDRKALTEVRPDLVPEGLRANAKLVAIPRETLWRVLTGTNHKKSDHNK